LVVDAALPVRIGVIDPVDSLRRQLGFQDDGELGDSTGDLGIPGNRVHKVVEATHVQNQFADRNVFADGGVDVSDTNDNIRLDPRIICLGLK
jgi:hypothetical protein